MMTGRTLPRLHDPSPDVTMALGHRSALIPIRLVDVGMQPCTECEVNATTRGVCDECRSARRRR